MPLNAALKQITPLLEHLIDDYEGCDVSENRSNLLRDLNELLFSISGSDCDSKVADISLQCKVADVKLEGKIAGYKGMMLIDQMNLLANL